MMMIQIEYLNTINTIIIMTIIMTKEIRLVSWWAGRVKRCQHAFILTLSSGGVCVRLKRNANAGGVKLSPIISCLLVGDIFPHIIVVDSS